MGRPVVVPFLCVMFIILFHFVVILKQSVYIVAESNRCYYGSWQLIVLYHSIGGITIVPRSEIA